MDSGISFTIATALMPGRRIGTSPSASYTTGSLGRSCWLGGGETAESSFARDRIALKSRPRRDLAGLQPRSQVGLDCFRLVVRRITLHNRAIGADKELREIPLDGLGTENPGLL